MIRWLIFSRKKSCLQGYRVAVLNHVGALKCVPGTITITIWMNKITHFKSKGLSQTNFREIDCLGMGLRYEVAAWPINGTCSAATIYRRHSMAKHINAYIWIGIVSIPHDFLVTSPRIFTGGNTGDYDCMVVDLLKRYPSTKIVCLGFSMGGNLVTKYLGERRHNSQVWSLTKRFHYLFWC